jgi:hypothetical protein
VQDETGLSLKPGDLVTLINIGKTTSMVVWATWNDLEHSAQETKFWPAIVGKIKKGEIAFVLEIYSPSVGPSGAKICASKNLVGWISCRCLSKINKGPD